MAAMRGVCLRRNDQDFFMWLCLCLVISCANGLDYELSPEHYNTDRSQGTLPVTTSLMDCVFLILFAIGILFLILILLGKYNKVMQKNKGQIMDWGYLRTGC
jgi:hypothetical protein